MKSLLLRRGASSAVVVAVCCSLLLGNAFGQEEDGHVFGDSNIDGQFLGRSSDKSMVNGMDSPECSMSDSGDVSFGGEELCFMSVQGAAALGGDYASLDGLYGAISCHDGRPLYSNIAGDGTVRMLWFSKAKQSWVLDAKLHGEVEPMSAEFLPSQVPSQNWLKKKTTSAGAFYSQASGPSYQRVDLEVRCSTKREAHIEKMRRQWIQHQDDKADGQMKWEDLQTHNDDYADEYEDDDNSRMTVSHGTEHTETAWSSWEKKEEKEVVKQIDHGVELVGIFILMVIVIGLTSSGLILILRQKEFQRRMYGHTNGNTWNHNIDWEQCQGAF